MKLFFYVYRMEWSMVKFNHLCCVRLLISKCEIIDHIYSLKSNQTGISLVDFNINRNPDKIYDTNNNLNKTAT